MKKKTLSIILTMIVLITTGIPASVFAQTKVDLRQTNGSVASEGDTKVTLEVEIKNTTSETITGVKAKVEQGELTYAPYSDVEVSLGSIEPGTKKTAQWSMNITGLSVLEKTYLMPVVVTDESGVIGKLDTRVYISKMFEEYPDPDPNITYNPQVTINARPESGSMSAGKSNNINVVIANTGNAALSNVTISIGALGTDMSLKNSPTELMVGSIAKKAEKTATFPIEIDKKSEGGNVPFSFTIKGNDPNGKEYSYTKTEYITVEGGSGEIDSLEISNITSPTKAEPGKDFKISFSVRNTGASEVKNVKITAEPTAPVVNKTKNIFVTNIPAGSSKSFEVTMFSTTNTEAKNYPIKITAETTGKDADVISQYTGIYIDADSSKTVPQLMVSDYSYGEKFVEANKPFDLRLTLKNTNSKQAIKNIKVSISSDEGTFIPMDSSNSFYIDQIGPGGASIKTISMISKPDAPQKTIGMYVDMSYEDASGNAITSKDTISIPVVQDLRLVIDDIIPPTELYAGQQSSVSVQFYNMGKVDLTNLRITAEGENIEFSQSPSMFVGNFGAGKNDYYDLSITPMSPGEVSGKVIFSFENSAGAEETIEKEFNFTAMEMMIPEIPEDPNLIDPSISSSGNLKWIILAAVGAGVVGFILFKKYKKKKMDDSLKIED